VIRNFCSSIRRTRVVRRRFRTPAAQPVHGTAGGQKGEGCEAGISYARLLCRLRSRCHSGILRRDSRVLIAVLLGLAAQLHKASSDLINAAPGSAPPPLVVPNPTTCRTGFQGAVFPRIGAESAPMTWLEREPLNSLGQQKCAGNTMKRSQPSASASGSRSRRRYQEQPTQLPTHECTFGT
jgi:hypothetical protein